ncbi:DUF721 domain-containing protein [Spirochaeta lutea]|uniref:DUF721 domain-containing protein n=1 Tax=Spirochaeta lutea TaxID=1480694 RepID=UPI00055E008D|nr:DUF721 domain-containing protein [Spirochaeta lutea]
MNRVADIISRYFENHSMEGTGGEVSSFFTRWQEIAGPGLADHSRIADIRHGSVIVYVDHPGWMQKLSMQKNRILRSIQKRYPSLEITNLLMRCVDKKTFRGAQTIEEQQRAIQQAGIRKEYPADSESGEIQESLGENRDLSKITDPKLRELLERFSEEGRGKSAD